MANYYSLNDDGSVTSITTKGSSAPRDRSNKTAMVKGDTSIALDDAKTADAINAKLQQLFERALTPDQRRSFLTEMCHGHTIGTLSQVTLAQYAFKSQNWKLLAELGISPPTAAEKKASSLEQLLEQRIITGITLKEFEYRAALSPMGTEVPESAQIVLLNQNDDKIKAATLIPTIYPTKILLTDTYGKKFVTVNDGKELPSVYSTDKYTKSRSDSDIAKSYLKTKLRWPGADKLQHIKTLGLQGGKENSTFHVALADIPGTSIKKGMVYRQTPHTVVLLEKEDTLTKKAQKAGLTLESKPKNLTRADDIKAAKAGTSIMTRGRLLRETSSTKMEGAVSSTSYAFKSTARFIHDIVNSIGDLVPAMGIVALDHFNDIEVEQPPVQEDDAPPAAIPAGYEGTLIQRLQAIAQLTEDNEFEVQAWIGNTLNEALEGIHNPNSNEELSNAIETILRNNEGIRNAHYIQQIVNILPGHTLGLVPNPVGGNGLGFTEATLLERLNALTRIAPIEPQAWIDRAIEDGLATSNDDLFTSIDYLTWDVTLLRTYGSIINIMATLRNNLLQAEQDLIIRSRLQWLRDQGELDNHDINRWIDQIINNINVINTHQQLHGVILNIVQNNQTLGQGINYTAVMERLTQLLGQGHDAPPQTLQELLEQLPNTVFNAQYTMNDWLEQARELAGGVDNDELRTQIEALNLGVQITGLQTYGAIMQALGLEVEQDVQDDQPENIGLAERWGRRFWNSTASIVNFVVRNNPMHDPGQDLLGYYNADTFLISGDTPGEVYGQAAIGANQQQEQIQ